jgi:hypothetical protein
MASNPLFGAGTVQGICNIGSVYYRMICSQKSGAVRIYRGWDGSNVSRQAGRQPAEEKNKGEKE